MYNYSRANFIKYYGNIYLELYIYFCNFSLQNFISIIMKTSSIKLLGTWFVILASCFVFSNTKAQAPCFKIYNTTACSAEVTWETVDASNGHIDGANFVTIAAYSTLNITGASCAGAVDIYVRLETLGGFSTGQSQPINGVNSPTYTNEAGTNANTCNGGTWYIDWNTTGNPVLIQ